MKPALPATLAAVAAGVGFFLWARDFVTFAAGVLGLLALTAVAFVTSRVLLDRAAASIVRQLQGPLLTTHAFRGATFAEHPALDASAYSRATEALSALGFRPLGDVEDTTVSAINPRQRTLVRWLARDDGTVAELFEFDTSAQADRDRALPARRLLVALRTELSDGTLVATSNAGEVRLLKPPPTTDGRVLPWPSSPIDLAGAHDARLANHRARGAAPATRPASVGDVEAQLERLRRTELAWRQGRGWLTEADLLHLAGPAGAETVRHLWPYVQARLAPSPKLR